MLQSKGSPRVGHDVATEQQNSSSPTVTVILVSYVVTDAPPLTGMQAPVAHHRKEL